MAKKGQEIAPLEQYEAAKVVLYPVSSEKSLRLMESANKLVFVVRKQADKPAVKSAIEKQFQVKVTKVNIFTNARGEKRAYVTFSQETPAIDVATKMGLV